MAYNKTAAILNLFDITRGSAFLCGVRVMQVCEHRLQRHLMGCILKQEDESVASVRFRMRVGAILARYITGAFGEAIFVSFWSLNLCFVLNNLISR